MLCATWFPLHTNESNHHLGGPHCLGRNHTYDETRQAYLGKLPTRASPRGRPAQGATTSWKTSNRASLGHSHQFVAPLATLDVDNATVPKVRETIDGQNRVATVLVSVRLYSNLVLPIHHQHEILKILQFFERGEHYDHDFSPIEQGIANDETLQPSHAPFMHFGCNLFSSYTTISQRPSTKLHFFCSL